ncbi:trace amine-associated receptor 1b [Danio rerio]|nr:trace amine-associated receptor 1b [Danio rerio]AAI63111.1 Trace amine associated receptor 1b [Danio rerio]AAI63112.1 Trace amine associated receptor 1b [Danio rerio]|eukprot:NP_001076373.1 trace amine-associated receptor 1 [Danio rerio]
MDLCYEAMNGSCWKYVRPHAIHVPMLIAIMLIISMTFIGNLLVIISIGHFRQLHTPTNQLILSLALCDFLIGLFVMPLSAVRSMQGCWYFGEFLCKLHTCIDITLSTSSIFHLVSVSAERFCAVCGPLRYRSCFGLSTVLLMISISWLIPGIFAYVMTFLEINIHGGKDFYDAHVRCVGGCHVFFSHGPAVFTSVFSFYIPGFIIVVIYSRIYMVARNQERSIRLQLNQLRRVYPSRDVQLQTRKATVTIAIVVGAFLVCWTPFFLCNILNPFIGYATPPMLIDVLMWFGYANSTLNPFIYAFMHSWCRKAVRIIVTGEIFKNNSSRKDLYT